MFGRTLKIVSARLRSDHLRVDTPRERRLNLGQGDRIHDSFVGLLFLTGDKVRKEISQHAEKSQTGNAVGRENPRAAACKASGG